MSDVRPNPAHAAPPFDEEEDLFAFDELSEPQVELSASATIAPPSAPLPEPLGAGAGAPAAFTAPAAVLPAPPPAAAPTPTSVAALGNALAPSASAPARSAAPPAGSPAVAPLTQPAPRPWAKLELKGAPVLLAALALFGLANVALIGLVWKSMGALQQSLRAGPDPSAPVIADARSGAGVEPTAENEAPRPPARLDPRPEGEEALAAARDSIERGDFEGARRRLCALLAVADRWDVDRRDDLEARASFLIADAYRLQAEKRAAARAAEPAPERDGAVHAAAPRSGAEGAIR